MPNFQEYMTSALAEAGLTDEQVTTALGKIYSNEKLGTKLNSLVKTATEDYNSLAGRVKSYQEWYPKAQTEYDRMATEYTKALQELTALKGSATPGGDPTPAFDASKYVSKEDLVAMQIDMGKRYAGVIKDTASITSKHVTRFKEEPDFGAIDKLATDLNIPLTVAYEKYIEPRVKEEEKSARVNWEKEKREEIERDLRSRYQLPVEQQPQEQGLLFRKGVEAPKDMDAELIQAWHSVPAKA